MSNVINSKTVNDIRYVGIYEKRVAIIVKYPENTNRSFNPHTVETWENITLEEAKELINNWMEEL